MPDNKNILLISYYFPPLGMGGVKRPYALYKYLPEYGYNVIVLTVKNICYPEHDYSRQLFLADNSIYRTGSFDPARLMYLLGKKKHSISGAGLGRRGRLFFPDSKKGWNRFALHKAKKIIQSKNIAAIVTTSPPPSTHLIGLKLKSLFDIPWIADFRDFWFSLPIEKVYATDKLISHANDIKNIIIDSADEIVTVNSSIKKYLGRGEVVMNGAEIENINSGEVAKQNDEKFIIGVLGTINYLCPIEPLLKAIAALVNENISLKNKIGIVHAGHIGEKSKNLINKYKLHDIFTLYGYLPAKDAINIMLKSDLLYISVAEFNKYHILPSRIFDCLASGLPVLGLVSPDSDAAALLNDYKYGKVIAPGADGEIADYIKIKIENRNAPGPNDTYKNELIQKYSTKTMAEKYARLLDRIVQ
jgi:hypothetical protein